MELEGTSRTSFKRHNKIKQEVIDYTYSWANKPYKNSFFKKVKNKFG